MRLLKKKKLWIIILLIILVAFVFVKCSGHKSEKVVGINGTDVVKRDNITTKVDAKGTVEFKDDTYVYPHEAKKIKKINVKVGDQVNKGDVLAEYDTENLDALKQQLSEAKINLNNAKISLESAKLPATSSELSQIESQMLQAEKNVSDLKSQVKQFDITIEQLGRDIDNAKTQYDNNKLLYENGGVSKNDLDNSSEALKKLEDQLTTVKTQRQTALESINTAQKNQELVKVQYDALKDKQSDSKVKNQVEQLQLQVDQINLKIKDINKKISEFEMKEIAPVSGKIITVNALEGDMASEAKYIFEIADTGLENLIVKINVPENNTGNIKLGQSVELETENSKSISMGKITKIYPAAEKKQVNTSQETVLVVEVQITQAKSDFKKGYSIDSNIITSKHENVLVVPLVATVTEDNKDYVYTVDKDSIVHKKNIKIKSYSDMSVEVEGLAEGEKVILNPTAKVKDGVKVREIPQDQVKK